MPEYVVVLKRLPENVYKNKISAPLKVSGITGKFKSVKGIIYLAIQYENLTFLFDTEYLAIKINILQFILIRLN